MKKRFLSLFCIILMICSFAAAAEPVPAKAFTAHEAESLIDGILLFEAASNMEADSEKYSVLTDELIKEYIDTVLAEGAGKTSEWYAFSLSRYKSGLKFGTYTDSLSSYVKSKTIRGAVERQRDALVLLSCGKKGSSFIKKTANDSIGEQGIMSLVFGLHLLNNGVESEKYSALQVIDKICESALDDGGFAVIGTKGDPDVTAMVIQALAPAYKQTSSLKTHPDMDKSAAASYSNLKKTVENALSFLGSAQLSSGGYRSMGNENAESSAQVLTALTALGINPEKDSRFIKGGKSVIDALVSYKLPSGAFSHLSGGSENETATMQALYSLISYYRYKNGKSALYEISVIDYSSDFKTEGGNTPDGSAENVPEKSGNREDEDNTAVNSDGNSAENASGTMPENESKNQAEDKTGDASGTMSENEAGNTSEDETVDASGTMPENEVGNTSEDETVDASGTMSENEAGNTSEDETVNASGTMPENEAGNQAEDETMDASGTMPENEAGNQAGNDAADESETMPENEAGNQAGETSGDIPADVNMTENMTENSAGNMTGDSNTVSDGPAEKVSGYSENAQIPFYKIFGSGAAVLAVLIVCAVLYLKKKRGIKNYLPVMAAGAAVLAVLWLTDISSAESYYSESKITKENAVGTVTVSINCDTIKDGNNSEYVPEDGVILPKTRVDIESGDTVFDVLSEVTAAKKIQMESETTTAHGSCYISGINYLYEFDYGNLSGWVYLVNGKMADVGCGEYKLSDGDDILWAYTLNLGQDVLEKAGE